jgi:prevent-host-death family protein
MAEKTITATKLRRDLGAVLDAVARGETVHVTRQGRPLCTIAPALNRAEPTVPALIRDVEDIA